METVKIQEKLPLGLSSSFIEGFIGAAAIALSIIGLVAILPMYMAAIATIAVGIAFFLEGYALGEKYKKALVETTAGKLDIPEFGGGVTAEFLGGTAGVVLGLLALLNVYPMVLIPVAAIVYGTTIILGSSTTVHLNTRKVEESIEREESRKVARDAVVAAADIQVLIGLGAIVLGILALLGMYPLILSLVALLSVAFSDLFSGTAAIGRIISLFRY